MLRKRVPDRFEGGAPLADGRGPESVWNQQPVSEPRPLGSGFHQSPKVSSTLRKRPAWPGQLAAGLAIALVFIALNYRAYDGFFQDDELDNLSWAPHVTAGEF